jgi:DNA-directed RNA polymerase specialized sigma24 family protein
MARESRFPDSSFKVGEPLAAEYLFPLVYDELRQLARAKLACEQPGQTLQATALVHEAYLRLIGGGARDAGLGNRDERDGSAGASPSRSTSSTLTPSPEPRAPAFDSRGHFFAAAAEAMRRILVEAARRRHSEKRGGNAVRHDVDDLDVPLKQPPEEVLAVHEALDRLAAIDSRAAQLVKLRYFAGLTLKEAAENLNIAPRTADDVWSYAKAWLAADIGKA